ncbi:hypothetical protein HAX54_049122 [Datura stramonium]|uniref:Uncharacterized protein n=1 Tax=Datura stramonium TaxID=4076 RepID=A0ABS8SV45_DATST|nr:hypothetical protein [Datura stramonium]
MSSAKLYGNSIDMDDDFVTPIPSPKNECTRTTRSHAKQVVNKHDISKEKLKVVAKLKKRKVDSDGKTSKNKKEEGPPYSFKEGLEVCHLHFKSDFMSVALWLTKDLLLVFPIVCHASLTDKSEKLMYHNITPTSEEKSSLKLEKFFEDVNMNDVPLKEVPTGHNDHSDVGVGIHSQIIEQQCCSRCNTSASHEDLKLTESVKLLDNYMVSSFKKIFKLIDSKATKENVDEIPIPTFHQSINDVNNYDHDGYQHFDDHDFAAYDPQEIIALDQTKSVVKTNEGVTDVVSRAAKGVIIDEKIDLHLCHILILQQAINMDQRPNLLFEVKHPFMNNIDEFYPYSPEGITFSEFVDDGMDSSQR